MSTDPRSQEHPLSSPAPGPPTISAQAAARALCELFLANADRGDNAANDHLIAEMVDRIRTHQHEEAVGVGAGNRTVAEMSHTAVPNVCPNDPDSRRRDAVCAGPEAD